ncbi:unnamed protein product [Kuraishia capsulata CBS 1993]|uniref:Myb-like domain-containing protein n=1 Tax=Kuraishia capsulata CBS 1993 TaxID=1382522 RepID=W6MGM2_9ASCO|nr:uncharacterized protein KUCA_T00001261001 [Kuraishia capsulata CBS 1993]CDK25294.1 unnamed protein product [Kuraishia capsulata CBS 1993]
MEKLPGFDKGTPRRIPFYESFRKRELEKKRIDHGLPRAGLLPSYISTRRCIYASRSKKIREGTFWSQKEKSVFFHLLSIYSIHRLDLIYEGLERKKSKPEILTYYKLLKRESKIRWVSLYTTKKLEMKDIPIAYEMSDTFVQLEEYQAWQLRKFPHEDNSFLRQKLWEENQEALLDFQTAKDLSTSIFRENKITDNSHNQKYPMDVSTGSLEMLTSLARVMVRQLLAEIMEKKVHEMLCSPSKSVEEIDIDSDDVFHACHTLGLSKLRPTSMVDYWNNIVPRLKLELDRGDEKTGTRIKTKFTPSEYENWLTERREARLENTESDHSVQSPDAETDSEIEQEMNVWEMKDDFLQSSHFLMKAEKQAEDASDDEDFDESFEEKVLLNETARLERHDLLESKRYENILLTAMTTIDSPYMFPFKQIQDHCVSFYRQKTKTIQATVRQKYQEAGYHEDDVWNGHNYEDEIPENDFQKYTTTFANYSN